MAGFKSVDTADAVLNYLLQGGYTTTVWARLMTTDPVNTGGGVEVSAGDYAAIAVTCNSTNFPNAAAGIMSNGTVITFTAAAVAAWGTVSSVAFCSAATGTITSANLVWLAKVLTPLPISIGDPVEIPIGGAVFTELT